MNEYRIISTRQKDEITTIHRTVVVVYLYYEESVKRYQGYISVIPNYVDVVVISSNQAILDEMRMCCKRNAVRYFLKENRGRDVSALLVTARSFIGDYDFVCFLHDKKASCERLNQDTLVWTKTLWDNLLYNETFINNIISFLTESGAGLLLPPCVYGEYIHPWYSDAWTCNYDNVLQLAHDLKIESEISCDENPRAIGTAFWIRREILQRIIDYGWKYEDFPDEPMPKDGTISHAIERIFEFLAKDMGYDVVTIMSDAFVENFVGKLQYDFQSVFRFLNIEYGIDGVVSVEKYSDNKKNIVENCTNYQHVYVYGAGYYGKQLVKRLGIWNLCIEGVVVSATESKNGAISIADVKTDNDETLFILAVRPELIDEIKMTLHEYGYSNYIEYLI